MAKNDGKDVGRERNGDREGTGTAGLVALKGSEEQIERANTVRAELIGGLEALREQAVTDRQPPHSIAAYDSIINNDSAAYWIGLRGYTPQQIVVMEAKEGWLKRRLSAGSYPRR